MERVTSYQLYCRYENYARWYYFENITLEQVLVETLRIAHLFKKSPHITLSEDYFSFEVFKAHIEELFPDEVSSGEMVVIKWKNNHLSYTIELEGVDYPCTRKGVNT